MKVNFMSRTNQRRIAPGATAGTEGGGCGAQGSDVRCLCGSLVARLVPGGVEIKCRRCQRLVQLPLEPDGGAARPPP